MTTVLGSSSDVAQENPSGASIDQPEAATSSTSAASTSNRSNSKKAVSSTAEFGSRVLTDETRMMDFNAWDQVEWTEEQESHALAQIEKQSSYSMPVELQDKYEQDASTFWDQFYKMNQDKFFKERNWLRVEFPELFETMSANTSSRFNIFEIGCGTGSTVFPLLSETKDANAFIYAADFAPTAVNLVLENPEYDDKRCCAFVYGGQTLVTGFRVFFVALASHASRILDITSDTLPPQIKENSLDVCSCIFVLSAIHPDKIDRAINNLYRLLKPGGLLLFRDYGRYDMTQLRFKPQRRIQDHFYVRDEIRNLFRAFDVVDVSVDRRLLINRSKQLKMYRIWHQCKFMKKMDSA
ncbi:hypothetical protein SmJEL517_g00899 [Synchytrium microbalum]|uniref:tRNA N(3)-methylcytidine methyltransferase n=1 Tax=Synchytrium microbalum TaxID=1806994 RepID=A0A507CCD7_9FUNG|nr:uncharacterized protein SmJEL517_g00899 [Synchytrium microbalum]TPX37161.1 hypothetical protein SmJEL517_g00899 [Synchytrium microbalum]